jgi:hypothetical protein
VWLLSIAERQKAMIDFKRVLRTIGLAVAVFCGVNAAWAQATYTVNPNGLESFNLTMDGVTINSGLAGGIQLNYVSGMGSSFASVCTDISGVLYLGYNYSYAAPTGFAGQSGLDPTWGAGNASGLNNVANAAAAIQAAADIFYKYGSVLTSGTTDQKAGLQLAVWAALYNTVGGATPSTSLDGSRFDVLGASSQTWSGSWGRTYAGTTAAIDDAITYIGAVNFNDQYTGAIMTPSPANQYGLPAQEVLTTVTPVPEPTTLIAGGLLLLPFAASALRSRSRRVTVAKRSIS